MLENIPANTACLLICFMTADEITKAEKRRYTTCLQPDVPDGLYDILIEVAHLLSFNRKDRLQLLLFTRNTISLIHNNYQL